MEWKPLETQPALESRACYVGMDPYALTHPLELTGEQFRAAAQSLVLGPIPIWRLYTLLNMAADWMCAVEARERTYRQTGFEYCGHLNEHVRPVGFCCDRDKGHTGDHAAFNKGVICVRWPQDPRRVRSCCPRCGVDSAQANCDASGASDGSGDDEMTCPCGHVYKHSDGMVAHQDGQ